MAVWSYIMLNLLFYDTRYNFLFNVFKKPVDFFPFFFVANISTKTRRMLLLSINLISIERTEPKT